MARLDKRSLGKLLNDLIKLDDELDKTEKKIKIKTKKEIRENLEYIARTAVDMFYEDYMPRMYRRTYDLYNAYKIRVNDKVWEVETNPDFMKNTHGGKNKVKSDYIFQNSFVNGYHGGSTYGTDLYGTPHPQPGTPYWMLYGRWYKEAAGGRVSPEEYIKTEVEQYLDTVPQKMQNEFDGIIRPLMNDVRNQALKTIKY